MTILGPVFTALIMILAVYLSMADQQKQKILVADDNYPVFEHLKSEPGLQYQYINISLEEAQKLFFESDFTAILYLPKNIVRSNAAKLYVKKMPGATTQRRIEKAVEKIIEEQKMLLNNIDPSVYAKINTQFNLTPYKLEKSGSEKKVHTDQAYVGFFLGIAIYVFISLYGVQVMRGVMEEKMSRIVEVLICSVKPFQLMMGKIIGIVLLGLFQLSVWITLTSIVFLILKALIFTDFYDPAQIQSLQMTDQIAQEFKQEELQAINLYDPNNIINRIQFHVIIPLFLFYFVGGYLFYAALFSAVGAIVDNESDTQQFVLPITLPLVFAYIISFSILKNPEGSMALWFSIIPFTSPVVMMVRIAIGVGGGEGLPIWELILSMLFLIAGFMVTTWFSAKLYRTGILMYGKKPTYKELWKWLLISSNKK